MNIVQGAESLFENLIRWRRHFHENPELSFEEFNTANFIIHELEKIEHLSLETFIGGYGIVATLSSGTGPTIAVRADMAALPITDENKHGSVSRTEGGMQTWGHAGHLAILMGMIADCTTQ